MLMPALTTTFLFKIPTNCTRLVIYEYVEEFVEKIPQHFLEENKTHFFHVGAPMPKNEYFSPLKNVRGFFQHFLPHTYIQLV